MAVAAVCGINEVVIVIWNKWKMHAVDLFLHAAYIYHRQRKKRFSSVLG